MHWYAMIVVFISYFQHVLVLNNIYQSFPFTLALSQYIDIMIFENNIKSILKISH